MISTLILATALAGQLHANAGPPRSWVQGTVDGKATWLWGWQDANGWIQFHKQENPQVFTEYAKPAPRPAPAPRTLGAGMVLEANGTINSGVNLQATHPTGIVETNDPDLGAKLDMQDRLPEVPNDQPPSEPATKDIPPWLMLSLVGGVVLILILIIKD